MVTKQLFSSFSSTEKVLYCIFFLIMHEYLSRHFFSIFHIHNYILDCYFFLKSLAAHLYLFYLALAAIKDVVLFNVGDEYRLILNHFLLLKFSQVWASLYLLNHFLKTKALFSFYLLHLNLTLGFFHIHIHFDN